MIEVLIAAGVALVFAAPGREQFDTSTTNDPALEAGAQPWADRFFVVRTALLDARITDEDIARSRSSRPEACYAP